MLERLWTGRYHGRPLGVSSGFPQTDPLPAAGIERAVELMKNPQGVLSPAKVETLHRAVLSACDALDGVKDGLIGDPHKCHFDPASLLCKGEDSDACLTAAQVETVKIVYADVKTKKDEIVWTGYEPGGELQYAPLRIVPTQAGMAWDSIRILGHQDADYDIKQFDLDRDLELSDKTGIDAHTFDLSPFKSHGGKLLMYHGWADPAIPPGNTVNFYTGVLAKMGKNQGDWVRLFMVPGMEHCSGGPGTPSHTGLLVQPHRDQMCGYWRRSRQDQVVLEVFDELSSQANCRTNPPLLRIWKKPTADLVSGLQ